MRKCLTGNETCIGPDHPPTNKVRCEVCSRTFATESWKPATATVCVVQKAVDRQPLTL